MERTKTHEQEIFDELVSFFKKGPGAGLSDSELYGLLAEKLSRVAGKAEPWTARYPEGVHRGTIQPSRVFMGAVERLGSTLESNRPPAYEGAVPVEVFALPGRVHSGALIQGASIPCANPRCRVHFVPNVPWKKYCTPECGDAARKLRKESHPPSKSGA